MDRKEIEEIVSDLISDSKDGKISKAMQARLIVKAMEYVEAKKGLTGKEKKELVLFIFKELSWKIGGIDLELVEDTIELIVDLSRGKFNLNKFKGVLGGLRKYISKLKFSCLKGCFK